MLVVSFAVSHSLLHLTRRSVWLRCSLFSISSASTALRAREDLEARVFRLRRLLRAAVQLRELFALREDRVSLELPKAIKAHVL